MKRWINSWIAMAMVVMFLVGIGATGCHNLKGEFSPAETYTSSYELAGVINPLVKVYFARLEETGVLFGEKLVSFKNLYAKAKGYEIEAGNILIGYFENPGGSLIANYPILIQQMVSILADLFGGYLVNKMGLRMLGSSEGKYIRGLRVAIDPGKKAISPKGMIITPDQIILALNLVLIALDKLAAYFGTSEVLTAEEKVAYVARVTFVQKSIPDWL